jgi:hypothetical protein
MCESPLGRPSMILLVVTVAAAALHARQEPPQTDLKPSPDRTLYAVAQAGQRVGEGEERERLVTYTNGGRQVAIAHVWVIEPDGTRRAGIRGCEDWGWVDNARLFCEGTINPSSGIYLVFDARTGKELLERVGNRFVWSPNRARLANFGNVPHFTDVEDKSDSLELQGKLVYPRAGDTNQHWFRSLPVWSPDSRAVAVVDHRRRQNGFILVVVTAAGRASEYPLEWKTESEEWPAPLDFELRWDGPRIVVQSRGVQRIVNVR